MCIRDRVRRAGKQRILGSRRRRQRVAGRLLAPRSITHQIDAGGVITMRRQNAQEAVAGRAADEHRHITTAQREDVEIAGGIARLHLHAQGLPSAGTHLIVDKVVALELALDNRRGHALGDLDSLGTAIRVGRRSGTNDRLEEEQCGGECGEDSVHCGVSLPETAKRASGNNGGRIACNIASVKSCYRIPCGGNHGGVLKDKVFAPPKHASKPRWRVSEELFWQ